MTWGTRQGREVKKALYLAKLLLLLMLLNSIGHVNLSTSHSPIASFLDLLCVGGILFIFSAIFAMPFLETSKRANHWLRRFLYIVILVPIYLFSGKFAVTLPFGLHG
jgi:hypothetical protein